MRVWSKHKPIYKSSFLGVRTFQNPLDAWVVQEVISEVTPDVIVEAGTANGGSALLWAMIQREVNPAGVEVLLICGHHGLGEQATLSFNRRCEVHRHDATRVQPRVQGCNKFVGRELIRDRTRAAKSIDDNGGVLIAGITHEGATVFVKDAHAGIVNELEVLTSKFDECRVDFHDVHAPAWPAAQKNLRHRPHAPTDGQHGTGVGPKVMHDAEESLKIKQQSLCAGKRVEVDAPLAHTVISYSAS